MSKKLTLILALALVVGLFATTYAEVQNVKVGGDLQIQGVARNNFDLKYNAGDKKNDNASFLLSQVRVKVDADLTDNVATTVRLINERIWGKEGKADTDDTDIDIDLAYVTLKEFLYSPLTLTVGRQELRFGNALIIGDVDTNIATAILEEYASDLSLRKSFDAIRATLNYDPLVMDLIYAKVDEGDVVRNDDANLYGINAHYAIDEKKGADLYFFAKTNSGVTTTSGKDKSDKVYVIGGLLAGEIIERLSGSLEYAYQFGKVGSNPSSSNAAKVRRAWALQAGLNYALPVLENMAPNLGLTYTYLSGEKNPSDKKYKGWDPMFEDQVPNAIPNALFYNSNAQVINLKGNLKPMEDVTLSAVYGYYRLAQKLDEIPGPYADGSSYESTGKKSLGNALDITATYDYTEDVQFGLTFGWFDPGKAFKKDNRKDATQVIGSMKVSF